MNTIKAYILYVFLTVIIGTVLLTSAFSQLIGSVTINSTGTIVTPTILPLHIDGKYIKNSLNQTVWLRGVNKPTFEDDPDGIWMGSTMWSDNNVKTELDAMKSWGVNVIRCHMSVELWKYDVGPGSGHPASPYCAISAREAIKRLLTFAAERGMYVILDGYTVRCYWTGGQQDPLPFPPWQSSTNASDVIANVTEFVDFWRSVAQELKGYPNVIFEIWNEPQASSSHTEGWLEWLDAFQSCVNAIREEGCTNLILFNWRTDTYCNVYSNNETMPYGYFGESGCFTFRTVCNPEAGISWFDEAINTIHDPAGNLAFDMHFYRVGGSAGLIKTQQLADYWGTWYGTYNYTHLKMVMEYIGWKAAAERVPLFCGECGCDIAFTGAELEHELEAWDSLLTIFNEWGIHYQAFWWRNTGVYALLQYGKPWVPPPTRSGEILIEKLTGE